MKKKEYYYLNIIKCLAIIMVCSYHFPFIGNVNYCQHMSYNMYLQRFLYNLNTICIPLFFLVNGALLLNRNLNLKNFIQKILKLIIEFAIWRLITVLFIGLYNNIDLFHNGKKYLFNVLFFGDFKGINLTHFWFIPSLIAIYLLFPFLKKEFDCWDNKFNYKNYISTFILILFFLYFVINDLSTLAKIFVNKGDLLILNITSFNPFVSLVGTMLFYFLIGGYLHKNFEKIIIIKFWKLILIFLTSSILLLVKWYFESKVNGTTWDGVFRGYSTAPCVIMAISMFIIIAKIPAKKLEKYKFFIKCFRVVGNNTLTVYYTHWIFGYTLLSSFQTIFTHTGFFVNLIKAIFIVILFSYVSQFFKTFCNIKNIKLQKKLTLDYENL